MTIAEQQIGVLLFIKTRVVQVNPYEEIIQIKRAFVIFIFGRTFSTADVRYIQIKSNRP